MPDKIDGLRPIQHEAIHLLVVEKMKITHVAQQLVVDRKTIYNWLADPRFSTKYKEAIQTQINAAAKVAQERIQELMYAESESVSLSAAKDILSRGGYDAVSKSEITQTNLIIGLEADEEEEEEEQPAVDQLSLDLE